jgi:hypothetical protein
MKIFIIFFILLAASLMWGTGVFMSFQQILSGSRMVCRENHLKIQNSSSKSLKTLLELNKKVMLLRLEENKAKTALALAILSRNPAAIARANMWLKRIKAEQLQISALQNMIIYQHQTEITLLSMNIDLKLTHFFKEMSNKLKFLFAVDLLQKNTPIQFLAIQPDRKINPPFIYNLKKPFSDQQMSHSYWTWRAQIKPSHWLSHWLKGSFKWKDQCSASLVKKGNEWQESLYLKMGRSL